MNVPKIKPFEETAVDIVVGVLNNARFRLGERLNLWQLAKSRNDFLNKTHVSVSEIADPLAPNCEKFISDTIEKRWRLTDCLAYYVRYIKSTTDESSHFLYYEAIFSQPTAAYPIPQATVSVFFRVEDKHLDLADGRGVPKMCFRVEGQARSHDVRYVLLTVDWILAVLKIKIKISRRIEALRFF